MMVDRHTLEGLDACRVGSDDLNQPELADVAAQVAGDPHLAKLQRKLHAFDEQIGAAMHSVPVPAGLAERILAQMAKVEAKEESPSELTVAPVSELTARDAASATPQASHLRRTMLVSGGALAAAVLIAMSLRLLNPPSKPLTLASLDQSAVDWYDSLAPDWNAKAAPRAYPVSARLLPRMRGWQSFACPADRHAVAYDLTSPGADHRVTLLVVRTEVPNLAGSPPSRPPVSTEGRLVTSWREGELVYVLVIEGSEGLDGLYRRYVDLKSGPIA